jgi:hypothetical protein
MVAGGEGFLLTYDLAQNIVHELRHIQNDDFSKFSNVGNQRGHRIND